MSEYKLVPFEPTDEMGIAGCEAVSEMPNNTLLDHDEAVTCFKAMLAAAPDVQGEPVAYVVFADNGNIRIWSADPIQDETLRLEYGDQVRPLYAAPQPAEQQPAVAQLVEALEQCITSMLDSGYRANAVVIRAARAALAAHRKGGEA